MQPIPVPSDNVCAANLGRIGECEEGHEIPAEQAVFSDDCPAAEPPVRSGFSRAEKEDIFLNEFKPLCMQPLLLSRTAYNAAVAACGGNYGQAAKDLVALREKREAETIVAEATALYHPCDVETCLNDGKDVPDLVHWPELEAAASVCGIGPFPDDEDFSLSVLFSLFPAVPRGVVFEAYHEAGCRSDEAVKVLIRQQQPINQIVRWEQPMLNRAYEAFCGEAGFLTREECFEGLAAHGKQPEEGFKSLTSLNCKREAEITAAENMALFYPFDVEYYASGGEYDPDAAHGLETEGGLSDRDVRPSPDDEKFSISVLLSLFAVSRDGALAAYREAGCRSDEAVKVLIRQECPIKELIRGRQPQLNIAYELFCGEGGFLTRRECIQGLAAYGRNSVKGFESLTLLDFERRVHHEESQTAASSLDLDLEEAPSKDDVDAQAAAVSVPSACTLDAEERPVKEAEDAGAAVVLALSACALGPQEVARKEEDDAGAVVLLALSACLDLEKVPREESEDTRVAANFGPESCALDVGSEDAWPPAKTASPPELSSNEEKDTGVLANSVSPVPPGPSGSPVTCQRVAIPEQGSGVDTHLQEQTGKTLAGYPSVARRCIPQGAASLGPTSLRHSF